MQINLVGLISGLTAFLSIWWGHIAVRAIEAKVEKLWPPMLGAILLGITAEMIALRTENISLSAVFGIAGMTLLWDAFEFYRQEKRVKNGHAPANPDNPRHARILANHPAATVLDWLDRDPRGRAYTIDELNEVAGRMK